MTERPLRVLLADDQRLVRSGFAMILSVHEDLEVVGEAVDGREALDLTRALRPDVVLMDVQMPVMDGIEATRAIVAEDLAKVVILTTFDRDDYLFAGLDAGASGFLLKNADAEQLADAIRAVGFGHALLAPEVTRRVIERRYAAPAPPATRSPASPSLASPSPVGPSGAPASSASGPAPPLSIPPPSATSPRAPTLAPATAAQTSSPLPGAAEATGRHTGATGATGAPGATGATEERPIDAARRQGLALLTEREGEVLGMLARGQSNAEIAAALVLGEATVKTHVSNCLAKLHLRDRIQAVVFAYEAGLILPGE